ncbi:MAG: LTA synthase family protein [Gammaproteobacteria bacterium]|jgi:phosphoglycerol transferase MdoB-like AlkP superfamily enzyme
MSIQNIPRTIRFLFIIAAINVVVFSACRVGFWWYFNSPDDPLTTDTLANAFFIGFKFDIRLALLMLLPVFLLSWSRYLNLFERGDKAPANGALRLRQRVWLGYLVAVFAAVLVVYITHFGYYAYLRIPLDATILRFFNNPGIALGMVWESYPVIWIVLAWLLILAAYGFTLNKLMQHFARQPMQPLPRRYHRAILVTLTGFIVLFGMYGKVSWYPLRWSDAFFSTQPFASAVTVNPVLYTYDTLKNKDGKFDKAAAEKSYDVMADYLGVDNPDKEDLNYKRVDHANPLHVKQPNIVVVLIESFASYKTGLSGNPLDPTPFFDSLAHNGIYFKNYFSPHTGTARSVFTSITSLPDIERHTTSSRNPMIVNQHTVINALKGYNKFYFIGGSASWGNIRGVLQFNIPDLQLYEEGSYTSPRVDVWGISDLSLFKEANKVLRKQDKPFFAMIQTAGNHKPYTIPEDHGDFKLSPLKDEDVKDHGFASVTEFNSFRFMDYCIQSFIETARKEDYFDNTIFVFYGDHGIHAPTGDHVPKYEEKLRIQGLRVPLVLYAPKLLPKGVVKEEVASEVDVMPTLAGLATNRYVNTALGRDLFDDRFKDKRYAFTAFDSVKMDLGVISPNFYFRMYTDGTNKRLHALRPGGAETNLIDKYPEKAKELEKLTRSIYETTRYMRFHNARDNTTKANAQELKSVRMSEDPGQG